MVLKLFTTFIVVAAILVSPKHRFLPGVIVPVFIEFTDCNTVEYGCVSLRMRFFSQNFGTMKRILQHELLSEFTISVNS